jgi:hypothetical protein
MSEYDNFLRNIENAKKNISKAARDSVDWLKDTAAKIANKIKTNSNNVFTKDATPTIGEMYMFVYDPKYKAVLPYYDMFPLVFPIEFYGNGFLGINLHYLPPAARISLMAQLKSLANNNKYDDSTRLTISYQILRAYSHKFSGFENCIKRYLFAHVRSTFHQVSAADWDKAASLPLQRWKVNPNRKYAGTPPY